MLEFELARDNASHQTASEFPLSFARELAPSPAKNENGLVNSPLESPVPPANGEVTARLSYPDMRSPSAPSGPVQPIRRGFGGLRRIHWVSLGLFIATCISTFFAGMIAGSLNGALGVLLPLGHLWRTTGQRPEIPPEMISSGLTFGACLMGILLAHEMGHFLLAKWHRIPATPPFFIPMPIGPFGTMGAVILQDARKADRKQLFDIAIAGPLAGLVVAIPVLCYGAATSQVFDTGPLAPGEYRYGDPLLVQWVVAAFHGSYGPNQDVLINPALFAGWVGIFITALNLLPVGQLDGGHILYTLLGKRSHPVAIATILSGVAWMAFSKRMDYALILFLLLFFGPIHPPTANDRVPLGWGRVTVGWATLAFIFIGFTPTPIVW